jgi:DNA repair protein RadA/Sms
MMKSKSLFVCSSCGYESGKWYGRCPECSNWNTFQEVQVTDVKKSYAKETFASSSSPISLPQVESVSENRLSTENPEFDRVLGGGKGGSGIVPGSVILLSGDPGVGKSTILLQLSLTLSAQGKKILYITGEESESQVKLRAERIGNIGKSTSLFIFSTTDIDNAVDICAKEKPDLVIVDSIQTMASTSFPGFPGSVPQIRYATSRLVSFAKRTHTPVILVGHVTKEGIVAGPMILSHMVDTVLYLEGEKLTGTRILRAFKNRFGDTSEVGIFIMEEKGLIGLADASEFFVDKNDQKVAGACLTVVMEGTRPLLVEVQALTVPTTLSFPRRVASGIADRRLELLLAVLQKTCKIPLDRHDVFINVVGGLKISETASDLAVCLAIISSFQNKPLRGLIAISEVGLLGELKTVVNLEKRIKEAKKFGFKKILTVKDAAFVSSIVSKGL